MKKETISLKNDVVITKDNVMILGEIIAVRAVQLKKKFESRNLEKLQRGMLYDIYHNNSKVAQPKRKLNTMIFT